MSRDEENRRLAEWLGMRMYPCNMLHKHDSSCWPRTAPDFRTDEAANALLLEKMPCPMLSRDGDLWECDVNDDETFDKDRKAAIVKAALAYLEAQQ